MWEKIKAELAALFGSQNSTLVAGVKSAVFDELNALKTEVAKAQGELATAKASLLEKTDALEKAHGDLATAQASVSSLTSDVEAAKKIGSQQALTITAAQGQPPVSVVPITGTSQSDPVAQYRAISDPAERVRFYRTNKSAIDSAFHNHNPKN